MVRADFISLSTTAVADDVPIRPGETKHLKIEERWIRADEQHAVRDHVRTVNQMELRFAQLSYGDGSGFRLMRGGAERYRGN